MGAVDTNDQMATVRKSPKQMLWYMCLIIKLLKIAAFNSYIIGHFKEHLLENHRKGQTFQLSRKILSMSWWGTGGQKSQEGEERARKLHFD